MISKQYKIRDDFGVNLKNHVELTICGLNYSALDAFCELLRELREVSVVIVDITKFKWEAFIKFGNS